METIRADRHAKSGTNPGRSEREKAITMKAITIWQPYATLIMIGAKRLRLEAGRRATAGR